MYKVAKIIDDQTLQEIIDDFKSGTFPQDMPAVQTNGVNVLNTDIRKVLRTKTDPRLWADFCDQIESYINDGSKVNQLDLLYYREGDFFKAHKDTGLIYGTRTWTTVTILEYSEDYEGEGLALYEDDPIVNKVDPIFPTLNVGETIVFSSDIFHEAMIVKKGYRLVIVAWTT